MRRGDEFLEVAKHKTLISTGIYSHLCSKRLAGQGVSFPINIIDAESTKLMIELAAAQITPLLHRVCFGQSIWRRAPQCVFAVQGHLFGEMNVFGGGVQI